MRESQIERRIQSAYRIGLRYGKMAGKDALAREQKSLDAGKVPWGRGRWGREIRETMSGFDRKGSSDRLPRAQQNAWDRVDRYLDEAQDEDPSVGDRIWSHGFAQGWSDGFAEGAGLEE